MSGKRIGQSGYWLQILLQFAGIIVLVVFAVGAFFSARWMAAFLAILLLIPLGIYFRVVQMRRCRDIGWPAFLPWLLFGVQILNAGSSFRGLSDPAQLMSASAISMILSLADFVFMIVLGCLPSKDGADESSSKGGGYSVTLRDSSGGTAKSSSGDEGDDPFDDAIARAMQNYRRTGSAVPGSGGPTVAAHSAQVPARPAMPPRVAGFGRKTV